MYVRTYTILYVYRATLRMTQSPEGSTKFSRYTLLSVPTNLILLPNLQSKKSILLVDKVLKKFYYLIILKYFIENGPEWGRRSVSGRVSRLLFRQILPPFILKEIVPRELLTSSGGQRYSKMYRLKRYRYTIFEKKIE
jgi:hypothetical protein